MAEYYNISLQEMEDFLKPQDFLPLDLPNTIETVFAKRVGDFSLRIYTGINPNGNSREKGKDAIRATLWWRENDDYQPKIVGNEKRVHRVKGWKKNLQNRIDNWEEMVGPSCNLCGAPTKQRKGKYGEFYGCIRYPACKGKGYPHKENKQPERKPEVTQVTQETQEVTQEPVQEPISNGRPFIPNKYQKDLMDYWLTQKTHVAGVAGAGSGKTTTAMNIVQLGREQSIGNDVIFVCFNVKNREDINRKLASIPRKRGFNAKATTMHSLCLGYIRDHFPETIDHKSVQAWKNRNLWDALTDEDNYEEQRCRGAVLKLVSNIKSTLTDFNDMEAVDALIENPIAPINLEIDVDRELVVMLAIEMLKASLPRSVNHPAGELQRGEKQKLDYDDMIYWVALGAEGISVAHISHLFVDETQDMSRAMMEIIMKHEAQGAHITVIGDPLQEINGFATASVENMQELVARLENSKRGCKSFPLPINQRCSKSVVRKANEIWPDLVPRDDAIEGKAEECNSDWMYQNIQCGDAIISRVNAPLATVVIHLLKSGKPVRLVGGKDAAKDFTSLIEQVCRNRILNINELLYNVDEYEQKQVKRLGKSTSAMMAIDEMRNKCEAIRTLASINSTLIRGKRYNINTSRDLVDMINALVVESEGAKEEAVNVMTGHRCKGAEFPTVFNLTPELFPHPRCSTPEQVRADEYLYAVVISRAEVNYYEVTGFIPDEEKHEPDDFTEMDGYRYPKGW